MANKKSDEQVLKGLAFLVGSIFVKDKTTQTKLFVKGLTTLCDPEDINAAIKRSGITNEEKNKLNNHIIDIEFEEVKE